MMTVTENAHPKPAEGEHVGGHPRTDGSGVLPISDPRVAVWQEDPPQGHGDHHRRVFRPRPGHGEGPGGPSEADGRQWLWDDGLLRPTSTFTTPGASAFG